MKKRQGFTLAELILAVLIFSFMMTSLATIYSTSSRNMFQNYRVNIIKTNVGVAMRAVQNNLSAATKITSPCLPKDPFPPNPCIPAGNILAFATNVDQLTGCYPVGPGNAAWHYFCIAPDPVSPSMNDLYYHTGTIAGGSGCASAAPTTWNGPYPAFCGLGGGGTVTILMQAASPNPDFFSRRAADGVYEQDAVRVKLRSLWSASGRGFGKAQRDVDFTMDTVIHVHRSVW
jgi:prepilin-type N-terminal cleavage/methylation domain-containing protein